MSHRNESSDVTRLIPFEINPIFFPPPTISLPSDNILQPGDFNYDFKKEYEAITVYKKEQEIIDAANGETPRPTAIDIISKLSYLPISGSKPKIVDQQQQPSPQGSPIPSLPQQPAPIKQDSTSLSRESPSISVSTPSSIPNSYAAALLPTWTPPQLSLDDRFM